MVDGSELLDRGLTTVAHAVPGLDVADRARRGMWLLSRTTRPDVGTTPHEVIHQQNKLVVRYYAPNPDPTVRRRTPVVIVPSMINRAYICDLEPDRSLVGALAEKGHPTYLVDWGIPGPEDAHLTVAHIVLDLLRRSVDRACRHAGAERALVLGYCQGGVLASMLTALRPERVAGLVALATPARFRHGGRFAAFCRPEVCDPTALVDEEGLVSADLMGPAFKLLDPMGNWDKYLALEAVSHDPGDFKRALARERWLEENVPVPGKVAVEFIVNGYQRDVLLDGGWELRGERVDLRRITCPVLVTPCSKDFIAPPPACVPLAQATGSADVELVMQDVGHIGVVVGSWGPKKYFPLLDRWFRRVVVEG